MKIQALTFTSALFLSLCMVPVTCAADDSSLSGNAPLRVEDAEPTRFGGSELELSSSYERTGEGNTRGQFQPEFKYGFAKNTHVAISLPTLFGSDPDRGFGDVGVSLLSRLSEETDASWLPSIAVGIKAELPTGRNSSGVDTRVALIASRTVAGGAGRVHVNGLWSRNAGAKRDERDHRFGMIFGYSHSLDQNNTLVADYIHEQRSERGQVDRIVEVGYRRALTTRDVMGIGAGGGLNSASPKYRLVMSYQHAF